MPSPFPGMDPYLEDPDFFPDVHDRFISQLSEALNARLPPTYYSGIASRIWIETSRRRFGPDVNVLRPNRRTTKRTLVAGTDAAFAQAATAKPVIVRMAPQEVREPFLELYVRRGGDRLVATIELLSPANKAPGAQGRGLYRRKQRDILRRKVHLIEIDLLRAGRHTTAVPLDAAIERTGAFDYHVCVRPFNRPEDYHIYPILLPQRLPAVDVPLLPGDAPASVDLQAILDRCYDTGRYDLRVNYQEWKPIPPLSAERQAWADQLLKARDATASRPPA
jgi:hypothetical protein